MNLKRRIMAGLIACSFAVGTLGLTGCQLTASGQLQITPEGQKQLQAALDSFGLSLTTQQGDQGQQTNVNADEIETVTVDDQEVPKSDMVIVAGQITFKNMPQGDHVIKIKYKNVKEVVILPVSYNKGNTRAKLVSKINNGQVDVAEGGNVDSSGNLQNDYIINPTTQSDAYNIVQKDGSGNLQKVTLNANFKVTLEQSYKYQDPGMGVINAKAVPLVIFVLPEELKKDQGRIANAWIEDMPIPTLGVKITQAGNLGIASTYIKKYRDEKNKVPQFIKIAVVKTSGRVLYTIELKKELPKLQDTGINVVVNDFIIYVNKNTNVDIKTPALTQSKRLGWIFIPNDKTIGKVNKIWVDGILVPAQGIKIGVNPKTKSPGIFVDIKPFTMNPFFKLHKVVVLTQIRPAATVAVRPGAAQPILRPALVRLVYKIQVKFPKAIIPLIKVALTPKQTVNMTAQPTLDQQEVTTIVSETSASTENVVVVDESATSIGTELATEAVVISQGESTATSESETPASDELVTTTETVASVDEVTALDTETIDMSTVTATDPVAISNEPVYTPATDVTNQGGPVSISPVPTPN